MVKNKVPAGSRPMSEVDKGKSEMIMQDIEIDEEHLEQMAATTDSRIAVDTMKGHRRRIFLMIKWIKENYPKYAEGGGVVELTAAQLACRSQHHYKNTEDLQYTGLNSKVVVRAGLHGSAQSCEEKEKQ
jgi:hypothetical protein